ncbi:MAG: malectin domain-containing carbohydrate-binding protein [Pseudomonadota bacterium]
MSDTSSVTISAGQSAPPAANTALFQINAGGGALAPFAADQYSSGGTAYTANVAVSTSGVANAAPAAAYQTERYGNHSYTFGGLTASASYTVRLHFAETSFNQAGKRQFDVAINGARVLASFDIFAAVERTRPWSATSQQRRRVLASS